MKATAAGLLGGYAGGKVVNSTSGAVERMISRGGISGHIGRTTRSSVFGGKDAGYKVPALQKGAVEGLNFDLSFIQKEASKSSEDPD